MRSASIYKWVSSGQWISTWSDRWIKPLCINQLLDIYDICKFSRHIEMTAVCPCNKPEIIWFSKQCSHITELISSYPSKFERYKIIDRLMRFSFLYIISSILSYISETTYGGDTGVHFRHRYRCWYTHVIVGCDHNFESLSPLVVASGYIT